MSNMTIENAVKAVQCADLLLQDLQSINNTGDSIISLLVMPEIEKVASVKLRLEAILSALTLK